MESIETQTFVSGPTIPLQEKKVSHRGLSRIRDNALQTQEASDTIVELVR